MALIVLAACGTAITGEYPAKVPAMEATAISSPTRTAEIARDSPVAIITVSEPAKQEEEEEEEEEEEDDTGRAVGAV